MLCSVCLLLEDVQFIFSASVMSTWRRGVRHGLPGLWHRMQWKRLWVPVAVRLFVN